MTEDRLMCWHGNFVSLPWHICIYLACVCVHCAPNEYCCSVDMIRHRVIPAHNFSKFRVIFRFEYVDCCCPNAGVGAYDLYLDPICTSKCAINLYNAICSNAFVPHETRSDVQSESAKWQSKRAFVNLLNLMRITVLTILEFSTNDWHIERRIETKRD